MTNACGHPSSFSPSRSSSTGLSHAVVTHNAFHASLLTPYKATKEHRENFPQPLLEIIEGEEEWVVEKVLDSRWTGRNKRLQYLLKWAGYPEADNSWEYKEDIFSPDLIADFHLKNPAAIKGVTIRSMSTAPASDPTVTSPTTCKACQ